MPAFYLCSLYEILKEKGYGHYLNNINLVRNVLVCSLMLVSCRSIWLCI